MLVITGLGRSGTSCLIGYCEKLGVIPKAEWFDFMNAGGEKLEVTQINGAIRAAYKQKRFRPEDFAERIQAVEGPVVKDPRFTWPCPVLLSTWIQARDDLRFLVSHRDFKSVAASKVATNGSSLRWSLECKYVFGTFLIRLCDLNIPYVVLKYPDYLNDYDRVYSALVTFGQLEIDYAHGLEVWKDWVDMSKVHFD